MKKFIKTLIAIVMILIICFAMTGCDENTTYTKKDVLNTQTAVDGLVSNQPTPMDIDYSLERYNLVRRAYWVNGQREKAAALPCGVTKPLGYIILFSASGAVIGRFVVDGKVSSLNSYLTANMEQKFMGNGAVKEIELPDIDGSYGENVDGIFFFTIDGKYIEYTGDFLYSDIPFTVDDPILKTE